MKNITALVVMLSVLIALTGCYRKDEQTYVISVPGMKNKDCAELIKQALHAPEQGNNPIEGLTHVQMNLPAHQVIITYDSKKIAQKNLEYLICAAGFEANGNPPKPGSQANLPEGCR